MVSVSYFIYLVSTHYADASPVPSLEPLLVNKTKAGSLPQEAHSAPGRLKYEQGRPLPRQIGVEEESDVGSGLRCLTSHRTPSVLGASSFNCAESPLCHP